jgi:2',3'-cyclic-nucleotide 2'-phosphodiesterase (5'-nucleotidase family)
MIPGGHISMWHKKNNRVNITAILIVLAMVLWAPAFGVASDKTTTGETKIILLHVNDPHAKIDSYAKIAWYVAQEKETHKHVFFLNGGDNFSGNPVVDMSKPKGEPVRALMNLMKYDAMVMGNHDFDYGPEVVKSFIGKANYPILAANIKIEKSIIPQMKPYTILKTENGIKLALLGLIQVEKDNQIPSTHPDNVQGISFQDPLQTAKKYTYLKKQSDVFIALTHIGIREDMQLAQQMGELDVIIGGHSHTMIEKPQEINGVLVAQAGGHGQYIGRIELIVKNGKVNKKSGKLIKISSIKESLPKLKEMIAKYNDNPVLEQVVTQLSKSPQGKFELGQLITDGIRKRHKLDIAFHNSGGIRSSYLKRTVKLKDIYTLHPFNNAALRIEMSTDEIRSLLRYDYERHKSLDLKASGIQYIIKRNAKFKVKEIILKDMSGKLLEESKTYAVGMNNYIALTYGFKHKDPGSSLQVTLAENLTEYLKTEKNPLQGIDQLRTFEILVPDDKIQPIGKTEITISAGDEIGAVSSTAGNLVTDAIALATGADIVTFPLRLLRPGLEIPANSNIYKEHIPGLYSYSKKNKIVTSEIKGSDLMEFFLYRNRYGVDLLVSGIQLELGYNDSGKLVTLNCFTANGEKLKNDTIYKVTFNQYEFNKQYKLQDTVQNPKVSHKTVAEMAAAYIKTKGTIPESIKEERIKVKKVIR